MILLNGIDNLLNFRNMASAGDLFLVTENTLEWTGKLRDKDGDGIVTLSQNFSLNYIIVSTRMTSTTLLHLHPQALRMSAEFRGVQALDGGDPVRKLAFLCYIQRILKYVCPFVQVVEIEIY